MNKKYLAFLLSLTGSFLVLVAVYFVLSSITHTGSGFWDNVIRLVIILITSVFNSFFLVRRAEKDDKSSKSVTSMADKGVIYLGDDNIFEGSVGNIAGKDVAKKPDVINAPFEDLQVTKDETILSQKESQVLQDQIAAKKELAKSLAEQDLSQRLQSLRSKKVDMLEQTNQAQIKMLEERIDILDAMFAAVSKEFTQKLRQEMTVQLDELKREAQILPPQELYERLNTLIEEMNPVLEILPETLGDLGAKLVRAANEMEEQTGRLLADSLERDENFIISVAYPKLLSKRIESSFLLQVYLPEGRSRVMRNIKSEFQEQKTDEHLKSSSIRIGQKIKAKLFSPAFDFPEAVTKLIDNRVNKIMFLGMPKDNCEPGPHKVLISISDADTDQEFESLTINVEVVDFAFDHISRPLLSKAFAIVLGVGSFAMFILTFLEQIDKTVGLTSGTAAGVLALAIYVNFYNLYQRIRPNTP